MADIVNIHGESREPPSQNVDVHGQAALMLVESLLHALVDKRMITTSGALEIIQTAQDVKEEIGRASGEKSAVVAESLRLLDGIANSFASDLN